MWPSPEIHHDLDQAVMVPAAIEALGGGPGVGPG